VLRSGRLSKTALHALEEYSKMYGIEPSSRRIDYGDVFPKSQPVIVEIGFGMGHVTIELAERYREYNFIGIEVYKPGVGRVLHEIHSRQLTNVAIIRGDAVQVLEQMLPDNSVHGFHIFFPDPWPKKKHHKRRLIQRDFLHMAALRLMTGGYFYAVTDWEDYAQQILRTVSEEELLFNRYDGYAPPAEWRPKTSFQRKGENKQYTIHEIWAEKVPAAGI